MINRVFETGFNVLNKIRETWQEQLDHATKLIVGCFLAHRTFYVTGSGHSHTLCKEFYGRTGGPTSVVPIMTSELTITKHPTKSSLLEKLSGYAAILTDLYDIEEGDVVLIVSNSGGNVYPIEMAIGARERGAFVIAITNIAHPNAASPRHESGKMLMDITDIVIGNCDVPGDCAVQMKGVAATVYPILSMANTLIARAISAQCVYCIKEEGVTPPMFVSLNSEGTKRVNDRYSEGYTRMYKKARLWQNGKFYSA